MAAASLITYRMTVEQQLPGAPTQPLRKQDAVSFALAGGASVSVHGCRAAPCRLPRVLTTRWLGLNEPQLVVITAGKSI